MTSSRRSTLVIASIFFLALAAFADTSTVSLRFVDSNTGYALLPDEVILHHQATQQTIVRNQFPPGQNVSVRAEVGMWDVTVRSTGFHEMQSRIFVSKEQTHTVAFHLDPLSPPPELSFQHIVSLQRTDATVVAGFIVDDATGFPLHNVSVRSNTAATTTNDKGYYQIYLPLASNTVSPGLSFTTSGYETELRTNIETWSNGDWTYNVRMKQGSGKNLIDESKAHRPDNADEETTCLTCETATPENSYTPLTSVLLPASIRVGRSCTGTSCTTVEVHSLQTYVKRVLPAEWYSCWGSLSNGMNSLQAGAVAIRSYGLWYVYHPLNATYDICDNTSCQVFGPATSTNANNAVDATAGFILTDATNTNVMRSEYSAENNNKGCGDGYTGTNTSWPCISDMVCQGQTPNGHGRGVCQWGTIRWANGTRVTTTSPCSQGVSHGLGTKTWQEILTHYYPTYTLTQGGTATITAATPNPTSVAQGSTFSIQYSITTSDEMSLILAASIAPTGTSTYTSDPAHDVKVSFFSGENIVSRSFTVPLAQALGTYDLLVAVWFDKNNNNVIDAGDFTVHAQQFNSALSVTLLPIQLASFTATVVNTNDVELHWRTLSETNNYGFFVERRMNGILDWLEVEGSFVAGNGTTNVPHDYMFTDLNVANGSWLYRLRQMDLDSTPHYTDAVQVEIVTGVTERTPALFMLSQNYPNPFNPTTTIRFSVGTYGNTSLLVFDVLGREVATLFSEMAEPGRNYAVHLQSGNLASGVYTYRLTSGDKSAVRKLLLLR